MRKRLFNSIRARISAAAHARKHKDFSDEVAI
jgi:hypothetical protein